MDGCVDWWEFNWMFAVAVAGGGGGGWLDVVVVVVVVWATLAVVCISWSVCVISVTSRAIGSDKSYSITSATKNDKQPKIIELSCNSQGTWSNAAKTIPPVHVYVCSWIFVCDVGNNTDTKKNTHNYHYIMVVHMLFEIVHRMWFGCCDASMRLWCTTHTHTRIQENTQLQHLPLCTTKQKKNEYAPDLHMYKHGNARILA